MQFTKTYRIIVSITVAVLLFGAYIAFDRKTGNKLAVNTEPVSTTTSSKLGDLQVKTTGSGYTIEQVPITKKAVPVPDLNRPVTFGNVALTPEAKTAFSAKITELQSALKKNPSDYSSWIDLGTYEQNIGDFDGAVQTLVYASKIAPSDYVALGNLGNLYAYYIKDSAKAESYYKQAITKGPTQSYLYVQLIEVYRDVMKDTAKAKAIVDQGLSKIPGDPNLLQLQSSLK